MFSNLQSRSFAVIRGVTGLGLVTLMLIPATMAAASPPRDSTLFGASISSTSNLVTKTSQFGDMSIVRLYYPELPPTDAWSSGLAGASHSAVIVSFKALPTDIISGQDNSSLENFFDTAPTAYPIYYTYYHEPEDNIAAGQFTLADYLAAWGDVVRMADAAHNPTLHSTLTLMAYDTDPASGRDWKSYLPAGGIISTLAWDAYPADGTGLAAPASFMATAVAASKSAGLPFGFAEFGTVTVSGRPGWLTSVAAYATSSGAVFCSLYDSAYNGGLGGSGTFVISDSASLDAWQSVVGGSGVKRHGRTVFVLPTLNLNQNSAGVAIVQYGLQRLGMYPRTGAVNGHYGPVTNASVRKFQARYDCRPPHNKSHFGPDSWDALVVARTSSRAPRTARPLPMVSLYSASFAVELVQYGLQRLGYYPRSGKVNGDYGPVTNTAVRAFQMRFGCVPPGNEAHFGSDSWDALTSA